MKTIYRASAFCLLAGLAAANNGEDEGDESTPLGDISTLFKNDDMVWTWGGRTQLDMSWASGDDSYDTDDGVEFRRVRLFVKGTLYDLVNFKTQLDFEGGDASFKDVYMSVKDTAVGEVKAGHFKEPFGLEELTSSRFDTFTEQALPSEAFAPSRNTGIQISDATESANITWAAGIFRDTDDFGNDNDDTGDEPDDESDSEYAITARVTGTPVNKNEGADLVHLGIAYSYRWDDDGMERFRTRPEYHLSDRIATTNQISSDGSHLGGLEAAWVNGPLSLQGEYMMASIDSSMGSDPDYAGYYVEGSYYLTGEHRKYKKNVFDRVKPKENVAPGNWAGGAWQVSARYSMVDLGDVSALDNGDELENYTLGLKWIWNPNTRLVLNWVHSEYENGAGTDDDADFLILRFQVDF